MKVSVKGSTLTIEIEMSSTGKRSDTGKTDSFATSGGNKPTEVVAPDGKVLYVGVNAYTRVKEGKK